MGVYILAKRVVLELSSSTNFVYSLSRKLVLTNLRVKIIGLLPHNFHPSRSIKRPHFMQVHLSFFQRHFVYH